MKNVKRHCLATVALLMLSSPVVAQTEPAGGVEPKPSPAGSPVVTFGIVSFLQYQAALHEEDGFNSFDVTRGYFDVRARLTDRLQARFTPDVRPTTDASLDSNMALRLEYAYLEAKMN